MTPTCRLILRTLVMMAPLTSAIGQSASQPRPRSADEILDHVIPEVSFQDLPADQVFDWLHEYSRLRIDVDWDDCKIPKDAPLTLTVKKMRLCEPYCGSRLDDLEPLDRPLDFEVRNNTIRISSASTRPHLTQDYDVEPLLAAFLGRGAAVTSDDLRILICDAIAPETWNPVGGQIAIKPGKLAIKQSRSVQAEIAALLERLRASKVAEAEDWNRNLEVLSVMDSVPEVSFQDMPFDQVIDWLGQYSGLAMHIDWRRIVAVGINRDTALSTQIKNTKLGDVVRAILEEVSGKRAKLGYAIRDGVLRITSASELPECFGTHVLALDKTHADGNGRFELFRDRLQRDLSPTSWQPGGGAGRMWLVGDRLVLRNSFEIIVDAHRKITGR